VDYDPGVRVLKDLRGDLAGEQVPDRGLVRWSVSLFTGIARDTRKVNIRLGGAARTRRGGAMSKALWWY